MNCSCQNCKNPAITDDRFLACFMCDNVAHLKCVGVSGLVFDSIRAQCGLRWFCHECDLAVIDLRKTRSRLLSAFSNIEKDFKSLNKSVNDCKKFLENCDFKHQPQSKTLIIPSSPKKTFSEVVNHEGPSTSHDAIASNTKTLSVTSNSSSPITLSPKAISDKNNKKKKSDKAEQKKQKSIFDITLSEPQNSPKPLVVIAPKKSIFISRLAASTTAVDVEHYIKSRMKKNIEGISVKKFDFKYSRLKSSFRIVVPEENFVEIMDISFWPSNTLVKEFTFKPKEGTKIAVLPSNESKN